MNPHKVDIFTEQEAKYNLTLLKKQASSSMKHEFDEHSLQDTYERACRTIEILSEHLLLSKKKQQDIFGQLERQNTQGSSAHKHSIILLNDIYKKVTI